MSAEIASCRKLQEEVAYEWAKWFNKFRSLYAMLLKRERSADVPLQQLRSEGGSGGRDGADGAESAVPSVRGNPLAIELLRKRGR